MSFQVIGKEGEQVCQLDALTTLLTEQARLLETVLASWSVLVSAAEQRNSTRPSPGLSEPQPCIIISNPAPGK
jgi:hypothetical protein